ncbi:hypothetical protein [Eubacterium sp.]|uniref:hypothetical protein n=1 Tax=Eubacterium sp. TaxID=142586 RepID=UPI001D4747D6|nr:hypothetical protein [Eubacterium sp.]MBS5620724.1 hypothetical protein [Eubacterium sp.]
MIDVEKVVFRIHNNIMKERGIDKESNCEMELRPKNGITSESIVIFLLELEDELGIEFDDYLPKIRGCKTIGLLIEIIREAYENRE